MAERSEAEKTWPTKEEIRAHAYEIYVARGADEPGSAFGDWMAAEAQLRAAGQRLCGEADPG